MKSRKYRYFKPVDIKPERWLWRQLQLQAEGLSGHLDRIWLDIRDSRWIGGGRDGWEMVPIDWKMENGMCREQPESVKPVGEPVKKRLYPYGCTTLRMTEMPEIGEE